MSVLKSVDIGIRRIISFLFRILLVGYSLSILIRNENFFAWYVYLITSLIYFLIFYLLFKREGIWSILRLINDYIFFVVVLYGKNLNDFHTITLLILPIVNSLNHSSSKRLSFFSVQLYLVTVLSIYFLRDFLFYWRDLVALLAYGIINLLLYLRASVVDFNASLYESIDEFYEEKLVIGQSFQLLQKIQSKLKDRYIVKHLLDPDKIVCFKVSNRQLNVVCTTDIVLSFQIENEEDFMQTALKGNMILNRLIKINGIEIHQNVFISIQLKDQQYIYFIELRKYNFLLMELYVEKILRPLLSKVTKVVEVENELKRERKKYLQKIKSKMEFVDNTVKGIHYLNNRLTPITNYFSMIEELGKMSPDDPKRIPLNAIINSELRTATKNISPIVERTRRILMRSSNPYVISEFVKYDFYKVFNIIMSNWNERNLSKNNIRVSWPLEMLKKEIQLNEDSFEYVIDEAINNMLKHSKSIFEVRFFLEENVPVCIFLNDLKGEEEKKQLIRISNEFNAAESSELLKKNNHGLYFMKQFLQQMNIGVVLFSDKNYVFLKLKFKIYND
jgi:hypothetical protein